MPYCYYTCHLLPMDLLVRNGYTPRWLGNHLRDAAAPARREALSIHPMTCPYVTKLVAAADELFAGALATVQVGAAPNGAVKSGAVPDDATPDDCLVVPGGCDAARRMGDLLAATYPDRIFVLPMPRSSGPEVVKTLAADLQLLEDWLGARLPAGARPTPSGALDDTASPSLQLEPPSVDYPAAPRPGGVFVVAGPLTDDSLLRLIVQLGAPVSGLESCTSPDRWRALAAQPTVSNLAAWLLDTGMCPRRSTTDRRDHLARRLDLARPASIIYARQSFCDPGAYDALLVAQLAKERGLPYLEIEVDFPFDANGPLRTRVEAFLEAQMLDEDLLGDLDDDLFSEGAGAGPNPGDPDEED